MQRGDRISLDLGVGKLLTTFGLSSDFLENTLLSSVHFGFRTSGCRVSGELRTKFGLSSDFLENTLLSSVSRLWVLGAEFRL